MSRFFFAFALAFALLAAGCGGGSKSSFGTSSTSCPIATFDRIRFEEPILITARTKVREVRGGDLDLNRVGVVSTSAIHYFFTTDGRTAPYYNEDPLKINAETHESSSRQTVYQEGAWKYGWRNQGETSTPILEENGQSVPLNYSGNLALVVRMVLDVRPNTRRILCVATLKEDKAMVNLYLIQALVEPTIAESPFQQPFYADILKDGWLDGEIVHSARFVDDTTLTVFTIRKYGDKAEYHYHYEDDKRWHWKGFGPTSENITGSPILETRPITRQGEYVLGGTNEPKTPIATVSTNDGTIHYLTPVLRRDATTTMFHPGWAFAMSPNGKHIVVIGNPRSKTSEMYGTPVAVLEAPDYWPPQN